MNQQIRKLFYTYRNGVVADALKGAGDPHAMIFGLQLPQLGEIAASVGENLDSEAKKSLAAELWADRNCRESRLLACYFFNSKSMTREDAAMLLDDCLSREETDILVFRSLRYHPEAASIRDSRAGSYASEALSRFV